MAQAILKCQLFFPVVQAETPEVMSLEPFFPLFSQAVPVNQYVEVVESKIPNNAD